LARALEDASPTIEIVRPFYFWLTARAEPLLYRYVVDELYQKYKSHDQRVRIDEVIGWVGRTVAATGKRWTPTVQLKVSRGMLAALRDFGILEGVVQKRVLPPHLSLETFCIIAFCLDRLIAGAKRVTEHRDWRLFFLGETAVERLLLESHQHGWLHYQTAGRISRVEFPAEDFDEYAKLILRAEP
jgi:hypothetical protein